MDENRTHPGRLNSAPQTVLKTAESTSSRTSPTFNLHFGRLRFVSWTPTR